MKRRVFQIISFTIGILAVASCAIKPPTTSDYDTTYDFSQLKSYAWILSENNKVSTLDNKRQINAIETVLNRKGFNKIQNQEEADFLLKTHTITDKKVDVDRFFQTWGYRPFVHPIGFNHAFHPWPHNSTTHIREYKVGTLVLDIVDPKLQQVVWRGSVSKALGIYKNRTPEERATIAMSNAEHMLTTFPPIPAKPSIQ